MNNVVRTDHPGRHRIGRNHRLLDIDHRDNDHSLRPFAVGSLIDISHPRHNNLLLIVDDPMTVDARYPYYGRMDDRPGVSSYYKA